MSIKIFVGYSLTPELKSHASSSGLITTRHQSKEFLGLYLDPPLPTLADIQGVAAQIAEAMPIAHRGKLQVFPQFFIG